MKRSRFSEEQIIGILKEHENGTLRGCAVPVAVRSSFRCRVAQSSSSCFRNGSSDDNLLRKMSLRPPRTT